MNEENNPPSDRKKKSFLSKIFNKLKFYFFFKDKTIEESVEDLIDGISTMNHDGIRSEEKKMIKDLLSFYDTIIDEIKIPRNDIIAVEQNNLNNIFDLMKEQKTSRIIVYENDLDSIIGFLTVKDLFFHFKEHESLENAQSLIKKILFVPPSMKAFDLLARMKKTKIHIATIIDEYGGTDGIVTINDIISEIVGTIDDNDIHENLITQISSTEYELSGRAELDELKEACNIDLYNEEYDEIETINGLIISINNEIPAIDDVIKLNDEFECVIKEVTDRMVLKVLLRKIIP